MCIVLSLFCSTPDNLILKTSEVRLCLRLWRCDQLLIVEIVCTAGPDN